MANVADCAFAIAKDDLPKLRGAIRRARPGEQSEWVYAHKYKNESGDEIEVRRVHRDDGAFIEIYMNGSRMTKDELNRENRDKLDEFLSNIVKQGFELREPSGENTRDIVVFDGWRVNWKRLKSYSYDTSTTVNEYDDYIVVNFGGRWSFPENLETLLNKSGVRWQGAGCEDGCDYRYDEYGNSDFGLCIEVEKDEEGYDTHYIDIKER